jgi:hypothetical protein
VTGNPLSFFLFDIEPAANNREIYHIEYLQNTRVQIEPPHQKQNNISQRKKCQAYFHIRSTASIHITNTPGQEKESPAAPQKTEGRLKMTYAQGTRTSIEKPMITANNTQECTLIKIMQVSFTRFETMLSEEAEQMIINEK